MNDILTLEAIAAHLHTERLGHCGRILSATDSTNTQIKQHFSQQPEGFILLAEQQTGGRGRQGRTFVSPVGGLYLSLLLHPDLPFDKLSLLTPLAAVAVCEAVEQLCDLSPQIKWVNDVFLGNRKFCGILTESAFGQSVGKPDYSIVGIGVNLNFDRAAHPELAEIVGALSDAKSLLPTRAQLAATILNAFEPWYDQLLAGNGHELVEAYRRRLNCLHKPITVVCADTTYRAVCTGLTEEANLIVTDEHGQQSVLCSGEIRIRLE